MPSIPRASSRIRSGSSQVHVLTRRPAAWHRSTTSAVTIRPTGAARRVRERRATIGDVGGTATASHAVGIVGASCRQRSIVVHRNDEISHRSIRRRARAKHGDRRVGDRIGRVEVGLGRVVLDLDVDPHAGAGVEGLGERRHAIRQLGRGVAGSAGRRRERGRGARRARRRACGGRRARPRPRPSIAARRKAARVFSGSARDAPRWAITCVTRHAPSSHLCTNPKRPLSNRNPRFSVAPSRRALRPPLRSSAVSS